ncbi:C6 zinc finger domain-containing protein [Verticillium alfalfae VaMs.102]|uniref:C6 zinc finger domain-containing protein n=1 Tax=Verticillium alfalfae (strain VaMs.102 / ATCC MYA-4576 / FGSC 10136) TaxID=526221 RepID=C9SV56_VERA1|nr:C6 zinc finger domain-containing protein [Verticillium alfalfae VaMs.102]EEY22671.1 C6 zinc finger domain-containing protein [Verticillium alfalfae VaMs.102]
MARSQVGPRTTPKTRSVTSRVKTGCDTCKSRRVKCDERWPFCWRCASAGLSCKGYGVWGGGGNPAEPFAQCLTLRRSNNPGPPGFLREEDPQVLEWFFRRMISKLQGVFPFPFWATLVPQACYGEPVIRSCVLALSSAHRRAVTRQCTVVGKALDDLDPVTLRHYNAAIGMLNEIQSDNGRASIRVALIACLMFVTLEYLLKRHQQGLMHLKHGLQILRDDRNNSRHEPADEWLADAFSRLDIQARLLSSLIMEPANLGNEVNNTVTSVWTSLHQARTRLDHLMTEALHLDSQSRIAESSANVGRLFEALVIQKRLQRDLYAWLTAYQKWQADWPSFSLQEQLARQVLLVYHTMAGIITAVALNQGDEARYDGHTLQFASIVSLSKGIFSAALPSTNRQRSAGDEPNTGQFSFSSDSGLVPPLFYTSLKCRHAKVRRGALHLLATKTTQEGIWDGSMAAPIAAEVIRLEEAVGGDPQKVSDIRG